MFIVILGWLYVIAMVAITAPSISMGIVIFVFGGLAPALLWLYIAGSRIRRARMLRPDLRPDVRPDLRPDLRPHDAATQATSPPDDNATPPTPPTHSP